MGFVELLLIAVGLSMDAFAVSVCKGLSVKRLELKHSALAGAYFGGFQFLMPVIGYMLGSRFEMAIKSVDHWIAFGLLAVIGANMIHEAFSEDEKLDDDFGVKNMLLMAIATSIDAMAAGISLAMDGANIWLNALCIGTVTFGLSAIGVKAGSFLGARFQKKAQFLGGVILILLGIKILLEHLGVLT